MRAPSVVKVMVVFGVVLAGCDNDDELPVVSTGIADGGASFVLTDEEGAQVVRSLNAGEVAVAQAVMPRLTQAPFLDFATRMVAEHEQSNRDAEALFARQGITPVASSLSQSLDQSAVSLISMLNADDPVDAPYIVSQITMHVQALSIIDCLLLPDAQDAAYRDLLTGALRPQIVEHLHQASLLALAQAPTTTAFDCARLCTPGTLLYPVPGALCP